MCKFSRDTHEWIINPKEKGATITLYMVWYYMHGINVSFYSVLIVCCRLAQNTQLMSLLSRWIGRKFSWAWNETHQTSQIPLSECRWPWSQRAGQRLAWPLCCHQCVLMCETGWVKDELWCALSVEVEQHYVGAVHSSAVHLFCIQLYCTELFLLCTTQSCS